MALTEYYFFFQGLFNFFFNLSGICINDYLWILSWIFAFDSFEFEILILLRLFLLYFRIFSALTEGYVKFLKNTFSQWLSRDYSRRSFRNIFSRTLFLIFDFWCGIFWSSKRCFYKRDFFDFFKNVGTLRTILNFLKIFSLFKIFFKEISSFRAILWGKFLRNLWRFFLD